MISPRFEEIQSSSCRLYPLAMTVLADHETPIRIYQKVRGPDTFLLESVEGGEKWSRYSFIGLSPFAKLRYKNNKVFIQQRGQEETVDVQNPILFLTSFMERFHMYPTPGLPRFPGGGVGYFAWELIHQFERVRNACSACLPGQDLIRILFPEELIIFDHLKQSITLVVYLFSETGRLSRREYEEGIGKLERLYRRISLEREKPFPSFMGAIGAEVPPISFASNTTKEEFTGMVNRAKEYIRAGDIFQVVLSQKFRIETNVDPLAVYRILRILNPSPYMYFLDFGDEVYVGSSPELLIRVEDGIIETRPIAGTRPRGRNEAEDRALERELLADEKELAEHVMLVDLGRNDIGRVAETGTVQVTQFKEIERYSHVMHIVSHVRGKLRAGVSSYEAFIAAFPAGTVSGAPKIRAMEIIAELEKEPRGTYAGAIGYLGFNGNLDTCIAIRTIRFQGGTAVVQSGAGIVHDSDPEREYQETVHKAKALLEAIARAERSSKPSEGVICRV